MTAHRLTAATIDSEAALGELLGEPLPLVRTKVVARLNSLTREFIDRSELPPKGEMLKAGHGESFDAGEYDAERAARYARREGFY